MSLSIEALTVLVILLPGFLCAKMLQWLCVRPEQSEMDKVVEALLYSFLVYAGFTLIFGQVSELSRKHVISLCAIAVLMAFFVSYVWTNDSAGRLLRKLKITHRTSKPSIWNDVFHHCGGYVLVELADRRLVLGWVRFYSDYPSLPALFLEDACWVMPDGQRIQVDGPGMLITSECGIRTISFYRATDTRLTGKEKRLAVAETPGPST